ncbi:MAG: 4Fe-4S binding protein [Bacilli bacterium]
MVANAYPMGWEKNLVKAAVHRTYNKLPSEAHVIVNNVQTAIEFAKSSKTGFIMNTKQITVSGEGIKENGNIVLPIGTKIGNLVQFMGGYNVDEGVVLLGGPMCSKALMNDNVAILANANALTVLKKVIRKAEPCLRCGACTEHCPANVQPVEVKFCVETKNMERLALLNPNACVGCGLCSYICPSFIDVADFVKKGKLLLSIEEAKKKAQKGGK